MEEKRVRLRNGEVEMSYRKQGTGDTTILFLHGWCINAGYWDEQVRYFSRNYRVYAIDLPGFGTSTVTRPNWSIEEYATDVLEFIEKEKLDKVVLVAHSMSGAIMMEVALRDSKRVVGLVGVDNFKFIDVEFTPEQRQQMGSFFAMLEQDFAKYAPVYADNMLFGPATPDSVKSRVKADFASTNPGVGYNSFVNLMQYAASESQKIESLPLKLHLINSDFPPTNTAGLERHCKKGFEVHSVGATGHYPMVEQPNVFNQQLETILKEM